MNFLASNVVAGFAIVFLGGGLGAAIRHGLNLAGARLLWAPVQWDEPFGLTTIEALACGLPVISSTGEFNDEILNDSVALRVDPNDVRTIREAVLRLKDNPVKCREMGTAAAKWTENFDINRRALRILDFMEQKIEQKKSVGIN